MSDVVSISGSAVAIVAVVSGLLKLGHMWGRKGNGNAENDSGPTRILIDEHEAGCGSVIKDDIKTMMGDIGFIKGKVDK